MRSWGIVITFFYGLVIAALMPAIAMLLYGEQVFNLGRYFYSEFWLYALILFAGEVLLITVPIDIARRKKISRKKIFIPVITSALLMSLLVFGVISSLIAAAFGDDMFKPFQPNLALLLILIIIAAAWLLWGFLFYKAYKNESHEKWINRMMSWLIVGSTLELLIAVPSHIIVRHKDECCADGVTFIGIVTGLSVMLLSFGPGIIFLYAKRLKERHLKNSGEEKT
jgi:hypothetical protein